MDQAVKNRIVDSFAGQSMMATLGAELIEVTPSVVRIAAPILPGARQQQGYGHAALTFALGDTAAGYAALTFLPLDQEVLTAEIKINLMRPAQGDRLIATGRLIKPGRRLCVVTAEVQSETKGKLDTIAIMQGTMVPVPR